jgi:hypothetical protein
LEGAGEDVDVVFVGHLWLSGRVDGAEYSSNCDGNCKDNDKNNGKSKCGNSSLRSE